MVLKEEEVLGAGSGTEMQAFLFRYLLHHPSILHLPHPSPPYCLMNDIRSLSHLFSLLKMLLPCQIKEAKESVWGVRNEIKKWKKALEFLN